jgi:hypothetical protein
VSSADHTANDGRTHYFGDGCDDDHGRPVSGLHAEHSGVAYRAEHDEYVAAYADFFNICHDVATDTAAGGPYFNVVNLRASALVVIDAAHRVIAALDAAERAGAADH